MLKIDRFKRFFSLLCCAAMVASVTTGVMAKEKTLDVTYVKITQDGFVADTLNGVEAQYNLNGRTLYCVELVENYYKELYGLEVRCAGPYVKVLNSDLFWFEETTEPKTGDVLFSSAASRGTSSNHWALVKEYDKAAGVITCFEQNWRWNGQAGVDRKIPFPSCYTYYTLRCSDPALLDQLRPQDVISSWAEAAVQKAADYGFTTRTGNYQSPVSREELCTMALKVLAKSGAAADLDGDVCLQAYEQGLLSDPNADGAELMTREQTAVIVTRVLEKIGIVPHADVTVLEQYADKESISPWASEAVAQMTATGILSGTGGRFQPKGTVTREQAISMLVKVYESPAPAIVLNAATYQAKSGDEGPAPERPAASDSCAASRLVVIGGENMMVSRTGLFYQPSQPKVP